MSSEEESVNDLNKSLQHFDWPDYLVFVLMLVASAVIGIYFGFGKKKSSRHGSDVVQEYLMGGKQLSVLPVALSLVARYIQTIHLRRQFSLNRLILAGYQEYLCWDWLRRRICMGLRTFSVLLV